MNIHWRHLLFGLTLALTITVFGLVIAYSDGKQGIEGWEKNSGYNNLYDLAQRDKLKGVVVDVKRITPLPGMAPGVGLLVQSPEDGSVTVHLGPRSFLNVNKIWKLKGARVKVRGVWAQLAGEKVFIAYKVKSGKHVLKVRRTRDGTPYWTMTPEELAKERAPE
ncbi:MAG: hypothetical protein PVJ11_10450 [Syntrophobacterales bacterium]|jgi:hypothetical protein